VNARCSGELRLARACGLCCEASSGRPTAACGHDKLGNIKVGLLVALAGGAVGEEHGGSRGGRRAKCDEEKAKVMFALTMEAAQGILMVLKPWARVHVPEKVGGGRSETVGVTKVYGRRRHRAWHQGAGDFPRRALAKRPQLGFIASVGCTVQVGRAHSKFY
jgi:hypothetical protein